MPVIVVPENIQKMLGHVGAQELIEVMNQIASTKVERTDFTAMLSAIDSKMDQARSDLKLEIHKSLLKGVVWVVGTVIAAMGIQTALLCSFFGK